VKISSKKFFNSINFPNRNVIAKKKSTIVFISGFFNVLHPGHLRLIDFASSQGDILVVGILGDKLAQNMTNSTFERISIISELKKVDIPLILDEPPEVFIKKLKPDFIVKGKEYENQFNPEQNVLKGFGGKLIFSSGETKSTILEINETINFNNENSFLIPKTFILKHSIIKKNISSILGQFKDLNVLVIGDTIVDQYVNCDPIGMSQEDPTIVVRPLQSEKFLGGASIVASHAKNLGANVDFYSVLGKDKNLNFVKNKIKVDNFIFFIDKTRPTTNKKRYRALGKTLLRVNDFIQQPISDEIVCQIIDDIEQKIKQTDLIILSDFNYGVLSQNLVDRIIQLAKANDVLIVADSQSSSQNGDISRFLNVKFATPTEREARIGLHDFSGGLVSLAENLRKKIKAEHIFITLGSEGILIHSNKTRKQGWENDLIPAMNSFPKDPAGGGDALLVLSSLSLATKSSVWEAAFLGSIAAACQVGKIGNLPLQFNEIMHEIDRQLE